MEGLADPSRVTSKRRLDLQRHFAWSVALLQGFLAACGGGGASDPWFSSTQGELVAKPDGGYFVSDPHFGGHATRVRLLEMGWGRLVDVHDVDQGSAQNPLPVLRDVVIGESWITGGSDVRFETIPSSGRGRLTILRPRGAPDVGNGTFESILERVTVLGPVLPRSADGDALYSVVARNATLVLRFDDLLADGPEERADLHETVRLLSGYPPVVPQPARHLFDPSHGGLADGKFHSTRVLIDFTVSEAEALEVPDFVPVNPIGLPASSFLSAQPNVAVRLPTRIDEANGRSRRLVNLGGRGLEPEGPTDAATGDMVRALRSGSAEDVNGGILLDLDRPEIVGAWDVQVEAARADPMGPPGFGFEVSLRFTTPCRVPARAGDTLEAGGEFYEVRSSSELHGPDGRLTGMRVLRLATEPLSLAESLLGAARFLTVFRSKAEVDPACWVTFVPQPGNPAAAGVDCRSFVRLRFSEPMDPDSVRAFDSFRLFRRGLDSERNLVIGSVRAGQGLQEFDFLPRLPLANHEERFYRVAVPSGPNAARDLSGVPLSTSFETAVFELAPDQPIFRNGGVALRFASKDELPPAGLDDFRGQVTIEADGILYPRPTSFATHIADRSHPIPALMLPFGPGVQTPLSPFGSKLQALWRYVDFGFQVQQENFHNLDVIGLYWSPVGGRVNADFYPEFEMRMAHSRFLPDESTASTSPLHPLSGLLGGPFPFTDNLLQDPRGEQVVVHPRALGYQVLPSELRFSERGTPLMPFPWNRTGAPLTSFTWRDTSVVARAGPASGGIPLDIETNPPLTGSIAPENEVPTIGLPLLWEIRCHPSASGLGFNSFDLLLPVPGFPTPNFRAFSTGGFDQFGNVARVEPDRELVPNGGFNPSSFPPGRPTLFSADNSFYVGAIDTVVRVSRAVTIWIDTGSVAPRFGEPVLEPSRQIGASVVVAEFRGADGFSAEAGGAPFDALRLDPYGDFRPGTVIWHGAGTWSDDVRALEGARYIQVRLSFFNDVANGFSPVLDSLGIAFEE